MPDDLEWPRRAIVGAIAMSGVARLATLAEGPPRRSTAAQAATREREAVLTGLRPVAAC